MPLTTSKRVFKFGPAHVQLIYRITLLALGLRCALAGRNLPLGADGLAYIDLGRAVLHHDWHNAVNGYWSLLYPCILAITSLLLHQICSEYTAVRVANFLIFSFALFSFDLFWNAVERWSSRGADRSISLVADSRLEWLTFGYVLFAAKTLWFIDQITPDLLVSSFVFLIASQLFRMNDGRRPRVADYAVLGGMLGVGFYAKTILFYFALFVLLAVVFQSVHHRRLRQAVTTISVFVIIITPFVSVLSHALNHITVGESGRLNYAWFVDGPETGTWMSSSNTAAPMPFYPGSILSNSPRVFRVPRLQGITYAPWYDPARFDKDSHPTLNGRGQFRQLLFNIEALREEIFGTDLALLVCLVILGGVATSFLKRLVTAWFCILPVALVTGMYVLVHLVDRFLIGLLIVIWGTCFACILNPPELHPFARRAFLAGVALYGLCTIPGLCHYLLSSRLQALERDQAIAQSISSYGVFAGDSVAVIGNGQDAYWAHSAGVSVVAELWSVDSGMFWSDSPERQAAILRLMAESGAKAAIWRRDSGIRCPMNWTSLPRNSGCIVGLWTIETG